LKNNLILLIALGMFSLSSYAQVLFEENFGYSTGTTLVSNGWVAHSGAGTNSPTVAATGLTYTNYPSSGIGGATKLLTNGEDVDSALTSPVTSGTVYASVLVKVDSATSAGDYFFHFITGVRTSNIFMGRLFAKKAANTNLAFGLSKSSTSVTTPPVYSDSIYSFSTTYLVVVKYTFNPTAVDSNDAVSLFIFADPTLPATEPVTPNVGPITRPQADATSISFIALRQGTASSAPIVNIDGIRVGQTWNDAPLPVQIASFTGTYNTVSRCSEIRFRTVSETNNYGFYLQRSGRDAANFANVSTFIPGYGTTNQPHDYSASDCSVVAGNWLYRLAQVDLDATVHYTEPIEINILSPTSVSNDGPKVFELQQNYPNPFNPSTEIKFSVASTGKTTLEVYNLVGHKVAMLFNEVAEAGHFYTARLDSKGMATGMYFYRLQSGANTEVRKMMLLK
jgi:hypothetical protein